MSALTKRRVFASVSMMCLAESMEKAIATLPSDKGSLVYDLTELVQGQFPPLWIGYDAAGGDDLTVVTSLTDLQDEHRRLKNRHDALVEKHNSLETDYASALSGAKAFKQVANHCIHEHGEWGPITAIHVFNVFDELRSQNLKLGGDLVTATSRIADLEAQIALYEFEKGELEAKLNWHAQTTAQKAAAKNIPEPISINRIDGEFRVKQTDPAPMPAVVQAVDAKALPEADASPSPSAGLVASPARTGAPLQEKSTAMLKRLTDIRALVRDHGDKIKEQFALSKTDRGIAASLGLELDTVIRVREKLGLVRSA